MPIINGKYKNPNWVNDAPPAIDAEELNAMSGTIERLDEWDFTEHLPPNTASYLKFVDGKDMNQLNAAFGKNNESSIDGIGFALAMYAKFNDPDIDIKTEFYNLIKCNSFSDITSRNTKLINSVNMNAITPALNDIYMLNIERDVIIGKKLIMLHYTVNYPATYQISSNTEFAAVKLNNANILKISAPEYGGGLKEETIILNLSECGISTPGDYELVAEIKGDASYDAAIKFSYELYTVDYAIGDASLAIRETLSNRYLYSLIMTSDYAKKYFEYYLTDDGIKGLICDELNINASNYSDLPSFLNDRTQFSRLVQNKRAMQILWLSVNDTTYSSVFNVQGNVNLLYSSQIATESILNSVNYGKICLGIAGNAADLIKQSSYSSSAGGYKTIYNGNCIAVAARVSGSNGTSISMKTAKYPYSTFEVQHQHLSSSGNWVYFYAPIKDVFESSVNGASRTVFIQYIAIDSI